MGCGQSKIAASIYPGRKSSKGARKRRKCGASNDGDSEDEECTVDVTGGDGSGEASSSGGGGANGSATGAGAAAARRAAAGNAPRLRPFLMPPTGPLLQQAEISSSQLDFFRMLDEKIENGREYDSDEDKDEEKESRLRHLLSRFRQSTSSAGNTDEEEVEDDDDTWDDVIVEEPHSADSARIVRLYTSSSPRLRSAKTPPTPTPTNNGDLSPNNNNILLNGPTSGKSVRTAANSATSAENGDSCAIK